MLFPEKLDRIPWARMRLRGCLSPDPKEKLLLMRTTEEQNNCQTCPAGGFKTMCGGQALIEGIMMRGPKKQAIVVRKPDGELAVKESQLKFIKDRYPVLGLPLVRGVVTFCASMVEGVKALMFSAEFYPEDEEAEPEEPSKFELWLEKRLGSEKMASLVVTLAVILGIGMSIGLFFLLPTLPGHRHVHRPLFPAAHPAGDGGHGGDRLHAGAERGGEPFETGHFCGVSGPVLPDEGHPPGL